jgi:hypothetical protein
VRPLQLKHPAYVKYRATEGKLAISIALVHHPGLSVYFYCASNHLVQVYSSMAIRGADAYAVKALVMVAEFKSLACVDIFCDNAAKAAIYNRSRVSRAFSVFLWWLVIPNTSA